MENRTEQITLQINRTTGACAKGEEVGAWNRKEGKIPVLACEGGCIRGEIARLTAHLVAKQEPYRRSCHGELFTVPQSAIANWTKDAEKVVLIDGCFLKCHGRILRNMIDGEKIIHIDALPFYKKYTDIFDIDDVPEQERKKVAEHVANQVLEFLKTRGDLSGTVTEIQPPKKADDTLCCGGTK